MKSIHPLQHFWQRRIYEIGALTSLFVMGVFGYQTVMGTALVSQFHIMVSPGAAVLASIICIISVAGYLLEKRLEKYPITYVILCMLVALVLLLCLGGEGVRSPYIGLWVFLLFITAFHGWAGYVPFGIGALMYVGYTSVMQSAGMDEALLSASVLGVPIGIAIAVWMRPGSDFALSRNGAYADLASEYSDISSRSDTVIHAIADGVITIDKKGLIELINPAAERILGWSRKDALKLQYKSVLKLTDKNNKELDDNTSPISRCLLNGQPETNTHLQLETVSGKKISTSIVASPAGKPGQPSGVVIIFRDVTKEQAEEQEQAEFISTASHEMRTPVASIEGYLGLTLNPQTATIDDRARSYIGKAHEAAQHLGQLFQDLLDVTRADDGRLQSNPKVVDIVTLTHDIAHELLPRAEAKRVRVNFKPNPDFYNDGTPERAGKVVTPVLFVNVDNGHLREIITNLIENAIKYTLQGTVTIDITGDRQTVTLSVQDTGIGIPKEDIPHLFQKFYRVDNSDTREIGGTGLGLYLTRRLVESMNGRLWVESVYKQGSTFFIELPRMDNIAAQQAIERSADDALEKAEHQITDTHGVGVNDIIDEVEALEVIEPVPVVATPTATTPAPAQSITPPQPATPAPQSPTPPVQPVAPPTMVQQPVPTSPAQQYQQQVAQAQYMSPQPPQPAYTLQPAQQPTFAPLPPAPQPVIAPQPPPPPPKPEYTPPASVGPNIIQNPSAVFPQNPYDPNQPLEPREGQ